MRWLEKAWCVDGPPLPLYIQKVIQQYILFFPVTLRKYKGIKGPWEGWEAENWSGG